MKNAEPLLVTDTKELVKLIKRVQDKVDSYNVEKSISKLEDPKDTYEKSIYQRALFKFDHIVDLE